MLTIHTSPEPLLRAARALNEALNRYAGHNLLLLLPGGSAQAVATHVDPMLLSPRTTISVGDERWTFDPTHSNTTRLATLPVWQTFLERGVQTIDPRPHAPESLEDTAMRFDRELKHWHITHRDGIVLAILGIGTDGHLAGILPMPLQVARFDSLFFSTHTCIRGYRFDQDVHALRMTVTCSYLTRHVNEAIVYAVGTHKHAVFAHLATPTPVAELPARILHQVRQAGIYTDDEYAEKM